MTADGRLWAESGMAARHLRCTPPTDLVTPVGIDPGGNTGPTKGQSRGPYWRRTTPGRYVPSGTKRCVEQRILEQSMMLPAGGAISGWAAMRLHGAAFCDGLDKDGASDLRVPLLIPPHLDLRAGIGSVRHRALLDRQDVTVVVGIPVVTAVRATFDAARWCADPREAVVALDIALAAGLCTRAELAVYLRRHAGARGVAAVRRALALSNPRTLSPAESRLRLIWVLDAKLPEPRCNWPVADLTGRRIGRPDILCEQLAVAGEFDGRDHRNARNHRVDVGKEDAYRNAGLEIFHVVGTELDDRELIVARMHNAVSRARQADRPRNWLLRTDPGPL